ncbi:hypothetical protein ILYODFUR_036010, partial [Ilyodon furcidens]
CAPTTPNPQRASLTSLPSQQGVWGGGVYQGENGVCLWEQSSKALPPSEIPHSTSYFLVGILHGELFRSEPGTVRWDCSSEPLRRVRYECPVELPSWKSTSLRDEMKS